MTARIAMYTSALGLFTVAPNSAGKVLGCQFPPNASGYVHIPGNVTALKSGCFNDCNPFNFVSIPTSVVVIQNDVFSQTGLKSIIVPNSVTAIGSGVFANCTNLTVAVLSKNVLAINDSLFEGCKSLQSVTIPNRVLAIGTNAFSGSGIAQITVPDSVRTIADGAFSNCAQLTSVTLPSNLTAVTSYLFESSINLLSILIPDSVTTIGLSSFAYSGLQSIFVPDSVTTIYVDAFASSALRSAALGNSVTMILDGAFSECSNLTLVTMGNSVTHIGFVTFDGCTSLTSVVLSQNLLTIESGAFRGCANLTSIYIPDSVTTVSTGSLPTCLGYGLPIDNVTLPRGNVTCVPIRGGLFNIPYGVTAIPDGMFYGFVILTSVLLPSSVTTIGTSAFSQTGLSAVTIPSTVRSINCTAFSEPLEVVVFASGAMVNVPTLCTKSVFSSDKLVTAIAIPSTASFSNRFQPTGCSGSVSGFVPGGTVLNCHSVPCYNPDGNVYINSTYQCQKLTTCPPNVTYVSRGSTLTSDRTCMNVSMCHPNATFEFRPPTPSSDRICVNYTLCVLGETFETKRPTTTSDRICNKTTECNASHPYQYTAPTLLADRTCTSAMCLGYIPNETYAAQFSTSTTTKACTNVSHCKQPAPYQLTAPTESSNRACTPFPCSDFDNTTTIPTKYAKVPSTPTSTQLCTNVTLCDGDSPYQQSAPTPLSDRVCTSKACMPQGLQRNVTWVVAASTSTTTVTCQNVTSCNTSEAAPYQLRAPTLSSNRECSPYPCSDYDIRTKYARIPSTATTTQICTNLTVCRGNTSFQLDPPTPLSDRTCTHWPCVGFVANMTFAATRSTATSSATCRLVARCTGNTSYQLSPPGMYRDRNCTGDMCVGYVPQHTWAQTPSTNTTSFNCVNLTMCNPAQIEVRTPTESTDRVCLTRCKSYQYIANATTDHPSCQNTTVCPPGQHETEPGVPGTTDHKCGPDSAPQWTDGQVLGIVCGVAGVALIVGLLMGRRSVNHLLMGKVVFVSYRHRESKTTFQAVRSALTAKKLVTSFKVFDPINFPDPSKEAMQLQVQQSALVLAILSPDYFASDYCCTEMRAAIEAEIPIIPVYDGDEFLLKDVLSWKDKETEFDPDVNNPLGPGKSVRSSVYRLNLVRVVDTINHEAAIQNLYRKMGERCPALRERKSWLEWCRALFGLPVPAPDSTA